MPDFVIEPAATPILPVEGETAVFPVRRVYCIGRNYAAHAIEMGGDPNREAPFFFQKNASNFDASGAFPYPPKTADVHHEVEMVVALKSGGSNIAVSQALDQVYGYAVGIDMTRRDLQAKAKEAGRPWEVAKAFERSAPVSPLRPAAEIGHPDTGAITLAVNGKMRQEGDLAQMVWKVPEMISYLSEYFELAAGDVILTGTPAGVGAVVPGDVMEASVDGIGSFTVTVVAP